MEKVKRGPGRPKSPETKGIEAVATLQEILWEVMDEFELTGKNPLSEETMDRLDSLKTKIESWFYRTGRFINVLPGEGK